MADADTAQTNMRYLHTMVRVKDLEKSLDFYVGKLGLIEVYRYDNEKGRFTNVFLRAPGDDVGAAPAGPPAGGMMGKSWSVAPVLEITYNWDRQDMDTGNPDDSAMPSVGTPTLRRGFGHLAYGVEDIYEYCQMLMAKGVTINRPPRDGRLAFVRSPDGISVELLQIGEALPPQEPWVSMPNSGAW